MEAQQNWVLSKSTHLSRSQEILGGRKSEALVAGPRRSLGDVLDSLVASRRSLYQKLLGHPVVQTVLPGREVLKKRKQLGLPQLPKRTGYSRYQNLPPPGR